MKLVLNIKPIVMTAATKSMLISKVCSRHVHTFGSYGSYLSPFPRDCKSTIRVYNLQKVRRKVVQHKNKKTGKTRSDVIVQAHWKAFVYDLPLAFLDLSKLKVVQNNRNFSMNKKGL